MKRAFFLFAILCLADLATPFPSETVQEDLLQILDIQKAAWNGRNIEGFMAYYWNSEQFTFQSGANRLRGWTTLLERYKKSYSGENWGRLDFTDLEVNVLGPDCAYVLGRWKLDFEDSKQEGVFTIVFKRLAEGWRIVHDHSS